MTLMHHQHGCCKCNNPRIMKICGRLYSQTKCDEVPYYVCSDIERELLLGQVQRSIINIEVCPTHIKQILRSKSFQEKVNINVLTPQVMSYLIVDTLPPTWPVPLWLESSGYK